MWEDRGRGGVCETKRKQELDSWEKGEKRRSGAWEERENAGGSQRSRADSQAGRGVKGEVGGVRKRRAGKAGEVELSAGLNGRARKGPP